MVAISKVCFFDRLQSELMSLLDGKKQIEIKTIVPLSITKLVSIFNFDFLSGVQMCGDPGISAFPDGDNIFSWKGTMTGSKDTAYEGMIYKLSLSFPTDYPFKPPKVKFATSCFHPIVDAFGNICLDILQDKWSSAYDVRTILLSIQSLLGGKCRF